MEGSKTKGRQKIQMKRIENDDNRRVSFSKRKSGIYKKASELVTLCGAEVGILVFSPTGNALTFGHPSFETIANKVLNRPNYHMHPHEKAHQHFMMYQLNNNYKEILSQLEGEQKHGKLLKKMASQGKGWWEAPIDELSMHELLQLNASFDMLQKNVQERVRKINTTQASSS